VKIVAAISRKKMLMNVKNAGLFSALSVSAKVARTNSKTIKLSGGDGTDAHHSTERKPQPFIPSGSSALLCAER
jgi:hypothetical protein